MVRVLLLLEVEIGFIFWELSPLAIRLEEGDEGWLFCRLGILSR